MVGRKVPNVMRSKSRVSYRDLVGDKPSEIMKTLNLSERGLQQELHKHCDGASKSEQDKFYSQVYDKK